MRWFDQVTAIPIIGVRFKTSFKRILGKAEKIGEFADDLIVSDEKVTIQWESPFNILISTAKGFNYTIQPEQLSLQFRFPTEKSRKPGTVTVLESVKDRSYSDALDELIERTGPFNRMFFDEGEIPIERIGIVIMCKFAKDLPLPGAADLMNHLGKQWTEPLNKCEAHLLAKLTTATDYFDRCHHMLKSDDATDEGEITFTLDWQRVYPKVKSLDTKTLSKEIKSCKEAALYYFEKFGKGSVEND